MNSLIRVCQKCGTEIPADAPEGGCPGCLLETALDAVGGQMVFGRYKLVKVLGRGGMGIVWLARDEELERDVALKFLPDLMIHDRSMFDELRRETKRCLELTHPHIVRIHDFLHDERAGGISMEYIDGDTLRPRINKGMTLLEILEIASQASSALVAAHGAGIIHRDIKPENIMLRPDGYAKVLDRYLSYPARDVVTGTQDGERLPGTGLWSLDILHGRVTPLALHPPQDQVLAHPHARRFVLEIGGEWKG